MFTGLPTVIQQATVGATGLFESIGKDGQRVEIALCVDGAGELNDGSVISGQPERINLDLLFGKRAKDIGQPMQLSAFFLQFKQPTATGRIAQGTLNVIGNILGVVKPLGHNQRSSAGQLFLLPTPGHQGRRTIASPLAHLEIGFKRQIFCFLPFCFLGSAIGQLTSHFQSV